MDVQNHAYNDQYGDMFTSVIPTNIFGEYDNYVSLLFQTSGCKMIGQHWTVGGVVLPVIPVVQDGQTVRRTGYRVSAA